MNLADRADALGPTFVARLGRLHGYRPVDAQRKPVADGVDVMLAMATTSGALAAGAVPTQQGSRTGYVVRSAVRAAALQSLGQERDPVRGDLFERDGTTYRVELSVPGNSGLMTLTLITADPVAAGRAVTR